MPLQASTGLNPVRAVEVTLRAIPVSAKHHLLQRVLTQTPPMLGGVMAAQVGTCHDNTKRYSIVCRSWVAVKAVVLTACKAFYLDATMQGATRIGLTCQRTEKQLDRALAEAICRQCTSRLVSQNYV